MNLKYFIIYHTFILYLSLIINIIGWVTIFNKDPVRLIIEKNCSVI